MPSPNSDRIAICGEFIPRFLKQRLLFFDRIGIEGAGSIAELLSLFGQEDSNNIANELEFLSERDVIFDARPFIDESEELLAQSAEVAPEDVADLRSGELIARRISKKDFGQYIANPKSFPRLVRLLNPLAQFWARRCARHLERSKGLEVSVLLSGPLLVPNKMKRAYEKLQQPPTDLIEVVLDKLPMPSELTPWEAILDFKADEEAQGYLQGLKVWMSEVARQKLTATEASEKLDWLLFQHQRHMKAHKLAYRWGTLGGTFVAAAEILEDLVKIKWGKAAGAVVSIVDRRLDLMKAELANPAKEVSYIVKAQDQFGE